MTHTDPTYRGTWHVRPTLARHPGYLDALQRGDLALVNLIRQTYGLGPLAYHWLQSHRQLTD